jgi:hypothetical protein
MKVYDADGMVNTIEVIRERGIYTLEVNGHFYCTCESRAEVDEEIPGIMQAYGFSYFR